MTIPAPRFVVSDRTGVIGGIRKETAEIGRAVFDFGCWLDRGETIADTGEHVIAAGDGCSCAGSWQVDYPLCCGPVEIPPDTLPLTWNHVSVQGGRTIEVLLGKGTPGLSYLASFLAVGSSSGRRKQINFCVSIPKVVVPMPEPVPCRLGVMTVFNTTALSQGLSCTVVGVDNTTGSEITITLPPAPEPGQTLTVVDLRGDAASHTIHVQGAAGAVILNDTVYDFRVAHQSADFVWNGSKWVVF